MDTLIIPEHLSEKKLYQSEINFLKTVYAEHRYLLEHLSRNNDPYRGAGNDFKSDFVLILPKNDDWKGVSIEIQGGIMQGSNAKGKKFRTGARTGHASVKGIIRDYAKCIACQKNKYFYYPVITTDPAYRQCISFLDQLFMKYSLRQLYN